MPRGQGQFWIRGRGTAPGPASARWGTAQHESGAGSLLQGSPASHIHSDAPPTKEAVLAETQAAFIGVVRHQWALNGNDRKVLWSKHKPALNRMQTVRDAGTRSVPKAVGCGTPTLQMMTATVN